MDEGTQNKTYNFKCEVFDVKSQSYQHKEYKLVIKELRYDHKIRLNYCLSISEGEVHVKVFGSSLVTQ